MGYVQLFLRYDDKAQRLLKWCAYSTVSVDVMLVRNGAVQKKLEYFGWKIEPKIESTDFQRAIYVNSSVPCDTNLEYINSFRD